MVILVLPLLAGLLLGWFHQRRLLNWFSAGLGVLLGLVLLWSILGLIDLLGEIIMADLPALTRIDLILIGIIVPLLTILGFGSTRWVRMRVSAGAPDRLDQMRTDDLLRQINQLAQDDRFQDHQWFETRWNRMAPMRRREWVRDHQSALHQLHLQAAGLGLHRLGRHAVDRIEQLDQHR